MVDVDGPWHKKCLGTLCVIPAEWLDCIMGVCGSNTSSVWSMQFLPRKYICNIIIQFEPEEIFELAPFPVT